MLKCLNFDIVYGLARALRKRQFSSGSITVCVAAVLVLLLLIPTAIAFAWTGFLNSEGSDSVRSAGVGLTILFSTAILLAFSQWYGTKWSFNRIVGILLIVATLSGWVFVALTIIIPENFSFSGTSAILLSANFLPACYIIHEKTTHKDIPL
jgi:hypothetical protein